MDFLTPARGGDSWKESSRISRSRECQTTARRLETEGWGWEGTLTRTLEAGPLPMTSKGNLCAGPVLASVSEPAIAWLVWGPLGIDNEVQERGVALAEHIAPI